MKVGWFHSNYENAYVNLVSRFFLVSQSEYFVITTVYHINRILVNLCNIRSYKHRNRFTFPGVSQSLDTVTTWLPWEARIANRGRQRRPIDCHPIRWSSRRPRMHDWYGLRQVTWFDVWMNDVMCQTDNRKRWSTWFGCSCAANYRLGIVVDVLYSSDVTSLLSSMSDCACRFALAASTICGTLTMHCMFCSSKKANIGTK